MSADETIEVRCPCCRSRLDVDRATGDVLGHVPPEREPADFDSLVGNVLDGEGRREDAFRSAFRAEKKRSETLDRKFDRARRRSGAKGAETSGDADED
jgi:hypothetical protein